MKAWRLALFALALLVIALGVYFYSRPVHTIEKDTLLVQAYAKIPGIHSYTQTVQTKVTYPDKTMTVEGTYTLNDTSNTYASYSTTSLISLKKADKARSFTRENISIGDDIYSKIEVLSGGKQLGIPQYAKWNYFKVGAVPKGLESVAIQGPTLANLQLFSEGGKYLTTGQRKDSLADSGVMLAHYVFKLSGQAPQDPAGTLAALLDLIGKDGSIDAWIDPGANIVRMKFANSYYQSTTTISEINHTSPTLPPFVPAR